MEEDVVFPKYKSLYEEILKEKNVEYKIIFTRKVL
jgi:hemerythrin superfamily protein